MAREELPTGSRPRDLLHSEAFRAASVTSERVRIRWTIGVLLMLLLVIVLRETLTSSSDSKLLGLAITLIAIAVGFEIAMLLRLARRAPTATYWWSNTLAESFFPSLTLGLLAIAPSFDPMRVLTLPAIGIYYLAILLSVLRLRPALGIAAGLTSAAGYLIVMAIAYVINDRSWGDIVPASTASHAASMLIAGIAAAAIASRIRSHVLDTIREAEELQKARVESRDTLIFGLAKLAEYRDTDTGTHLERIREYAALLAEHLRPQFSEINDDWIETLRTASSLHDIGKVGVPDAVLKKPGRLTDDEHMIIKTHAALGADAIHAIRERQSDDDLLEMSEAIARFHHERWDGKGYPAHVEGEAIPIAARIISVADVYDALTSVRVYKPAMSHEKASEIITSGSGTQFDPVVVEAFVALSTEFDTVRARYHVRRSVESDS